MTVIPPRESGGAFTRYRRTFRGWRRSRPFWGGLFTLLGGVWIFGTTQLSLGGLSFQMGPTGFLAWLIPTILAACGVLLWVTPNHRLFYSIVAAVTAVYSLIGVNLGGFFLGMLLALVGAALGFAWMPTRRPAPASTPPGDASSGDASSDGTAPNDPAPGGTVSDGTVSDGAADGTVSDRSQRGPWLFTIALLAAGVAATGLTAGGGPAYAGPCPISQAPPATAKPSEPDPKPPVGGAPPAKPPAGTTTASPTAPSPTATTVDQPRDPDGGNPIGDAVAGVVDGVKDLLGIGAGESTSSPAPAPATATPRASTSPVGTPRPAGGTSAVKPRPVRTGGPPPGVDSMDDLAGCSAAELGRPGPVVFIDAPPGQPRVARPSRLTGSRVTMIGLSYDGVVDLPTAGGTIRALQFSMDRSITDDFELRVPGPGRETTSLKSTALTVRGDVRFFASRFHGTLLGIPLTFTPDSPPPLTLPVMVFGEPDIQLVFVDCDTLIAPDLRTTIL